MATRLDRYAELVHAKLDDESVRCMVGRLKIKENVQRRRVVWVRTPSSITTPMRSGGKATTNATTGAPERIRACYDRQESVSLHIFAEDADTAEALLDNMLAALHLVSGPNVTPGTYEWETENPDIADISLRQPKIRLDIVVRMPVSDESQGLRAIDAFTHSHPPGDTFTHS